MIESVHAWLVAHPIGCVLLISAFFALFAQFFNAIGSILWRFVQIQPQNLDIWLLKARAYNAESTLASFNRLGGDERYFIYYCFQTLFWLICGALLMTASFL
ncbi:MAG TPA: hypothetical protein VHX36_14300, partial [Candidatus Acidoferrales bacterium]|nr:hypothetical protein [Candidatus Acidoferrales bacterium]